jgi:hypothetical protein
MRKLEKHCHVTATSGRTQSQVATGRFVGGDRHDCEVTEDTITTKRVVRVPRKEDCKSEIESNDQQQSPSLKSSRNEDEMNNEEYEMMLANDQAGFSDAARRQTFQYFGSLGVKSIREFTPALRVMHPYSTDFQRRMQELGVSDISTRSGIPNVKQTRKVWSAHELHAEKMPQFLRQVAKANQGPVTYIFAVEHGTESERPHVHFQLGGVANVSLTSLKNIWTNMNGGRPYIGLFDPMRDTGYTYKYIVAKQAFKSGEDREVLWDTNLWKHDRRHNSLEQSRQFSKRQLMAA